TFRGSLGTMANSISQPDTQRTGAEPDRLSRLLASRPLNGREKTSQDSPLPPGLSTWERRDHDSDAEPAAEAGDLSEMDRLRLENAELRRTTAEFQQTLEELKQLEDSWAQQQKEYEGLLEEKSEVIRTLHQKLQEMQETVGKPNVPAPREEELLTLHDELEQE